MRVLVVLWVLMGFSLHSSEAVYVHEGRFIGWNGETVLKLKDGSVWEQQEYYDTPCNIVEPEVSIALEDNQYYMKVGKCSDKWVKVRRIVRSSAGLKDLMYNQMAGNASNAFGDAFGMKRDNKSKSQYQHEIDAYNNWQLNQKSRGSIIRITNNNPVTISVAYSYNTGIWTTTGWYHVSSGSYLDIEMKTTCKGYFYLYAVSENNWWGDSKQQNLFCIDPQNRFETPESNSRNCEGRLIKVPMSECHMEDGFFEWKINE